MIVWRRLADLVAAHGAAALVSVLDVKGSAPREAGARMIVRPDGAFHGTIGGGQLEWRMLGIAREAIARGRGPARFIAQALGPDLGQCCGGHVTVLVETFGREDAEHLDALAEAEREGAFEAEAFVGEDGHVRRKLSRVVLHLPPRPAEGRNPRWRESYGDAPILLFLFGAGHVGRALALCLAPLPFAIRWIDSRDEAFPAHIPANATPVQTSDPILELDRAPADAFVLVMTHEHSLDLAITAAALQREFPYVGLIGSASKRARFEKRFREVAIPEERIRSLVCPIGLAGIGGKEPAIIAASVAAQLLQERDRVTKAASSAPEKGRAAPPFRQKAHGSIN
ncbi:MAG TPA: xanthine dehydrogenase accessory protein XdhC [Microvirga sp.]|nr:xanthine dehydrogenase accessory protein XdhC [Microvirga sp.]